jgi:hypothetical protein
MDPMAAEKRSETKKQQKDLHKKIFDSERFCFCEA